MVQENIIFAMKPSETLPGTGRSDIWLIYSRLVIFCSPDDVCLLAPLLSIQVLSRSTTCLIAREGGEKSNKISLRHPCVMVMEGNHKLFNLDVRYHVLTV